MFEKVMRKCRTGLLLFWLSLTLPASAQQCGCDFWNVLVFGFSDAAGWTGKPELSLWEVRFGDTVRIENQLEVRTGKQWLRSGEDKNPVRNLDYLRYPDLYHLFFSSRSSPAMYLLRVSGKRFGKTSGTVYYPIFSGEACNVCSFRLSQKVTDDEVLPFRTIAADVPRLPEREEPSHQPKSPVWVEPVYRRVSEKGKLPLVSELVAVRARRAGLVLQEFLYEGSPTLESTTDPPVQMGYFSSDHNRAEKDFSVLRRRETNALTRQPEVFRDFYFFVHSTQTYVKDDVLSAAANVWYQPVEDVFYRKELLREGDRLWKYRRGMDRNWVFVSGGMPESEILALAPPKNPRNCWIQKSESANGYLPVHLSDSGLTVRDTFFLWSLADKPLSMKEFYADNPTLFRVPAYAMPGEWTPVYYEETLSPTDAAFTWNTRQLRIESEGCSTLFLGLHILQAGKRVQEVMSGDGFTWLGPVLADSTREILIGNPFRYPIRKGFVHIRQNEPVKRWDQHLQTEEPPGFLYKTRFITLICDSNPDAEKRRMQFFAWDGESWKPALAGFSEGQPGVHVKPDVDSLMVRLFDRECRFRLEPAQKMAESKLYLPPLLRPDEPYLLLNGFREPMYWQKYKWLVRVKGAGQHIPDQKRPEPPPQKMDLGLETVRLRYVQKYPGISVSANLWTGMLYVDIKQLSDRDQEKILLDWEKDEDVLVVSPDFAGRRLPAFSGMCLFRVPNPEVGIVVRKQAELFGFAFAGLGMDGTVQMQWIKSKRLDSDFFTAYLQLLKVPGVISGILDGIRGPVWELTD